MIGRAALVPVFLACGSLAAGAQTHPCDAASGGSAVLQSGAPHRVQFCEPAAAFIEAAVVWVDGQTFDLLAVSAVTGPNAAGLILYETPVFLQVARGTHTVEVAAYNRGFGGELQLGAKSPPFSCVGVDDQAVPPAPIVIGLLR